MTIKPIATTAFAELDAVASNDPEIAPEVAPATASAAERSDRSADQAAIDAELARKPEMNSAVRTALDSHLENIDAARKRDAQTLQARYGQRREALAPTPSKTEPVSASATSQSAVAPSGTLTLAQVNEGFVALSNLDREFFFRRHGLILIDDSRIEQLANEALASHSARIAELEGLLAKREVIAPAPSPVRQPDCIVPEHQDLTDQVTQLTSERDELAAHDEWLQEKLTALMAGTASLDDNTEDGEGDGNADSDGGMMGQVSPGDMPGDTDVSEAASDEVGFPQSVEADAEGVDTGEVPDIDESSFSEDADEDDSSSGEDESDDLDPGFDPELMS